MVVNNKNLTGSCPAFCFTCVLLPIVYLNQPKKLDFLRKKAITTQSVVKKGFTKGFLFV